MVKKARTLKEIDDIVEKMSVKIDMMFENVELLPEIYAMLVVTRQEKAKMFKPHMTRAEKR